MKRIKLAVSSCLLGNKVRFDGGHKKHTFVKETLAESFDLIPVCPEMAIGLGVPRQTLRLVDDVEKPRAVGNRDTNLDVTEQLKNYGLHMVRELDDICGYIVKKDSPSCGMERVRVYVDNKMPQRKGRGIYINEFLNARPWLPVEEEGRLNDPVLRENFFERVYVLDRWFQMQKNGLNAKALVQFHSTHKYMLMSRGQHVYRQLGRMVAKAGHSDLQQLANSYFLEMMQVLKKTASRGHHSNVLLHLMGYLKRQLARDEKQELLSLINDYRNGQLPLIVPVTMITHHVRKNENEYLKGQHYFTPYPSNLMLRNRV